ncbi:hypothetical protein ASD58_06830 [Duganella sp. Root1480D1]|nr:hypothetical protein ASD58_06830 [Duganella sp. Root1480D1]
MLDTGGVQLDLFLSHCVALHFGGQFGLAQLLGGQAFLFELGLLAYSFARLDFVRCLRRLDHGGQDYRGRSGSGGHGNVREPRSRHDRILVRRGKRRLKRRWKRRCGRAGLRHRHWRHVTRSWLDDCRRRFRRV